MLWERHRGHLPCGCISSRQEDVWLCMRLWWDFGLRWGLQVADHVSDGWDVCKTVHCLALLLPITDKYNQSQKSHPAEGPVLFVGICASKDLFPSSCIAAGAFEPNAQQSSGPRFRRAYFFKKIPEHLLSGFMASWLLERKPG